jgi:hypothetical protein
MISRLMQIVADLDEMTARVRADKNLPHSELALDTTVACNAVRSAEIRLGTALHARHNERYPIQRDPFEAARMAPTEPLDPETRAAIDETP